MGLFSRKKKKEEPIVEIQTPSAPPECKHKWKDFKRYIEWSYNPVFIDGIRQPYGELNIKKYEPFVCFWCKKREDVLLRSIHFDQIDEQEAKQRYEKAAADPEVLPREDIEDKIADMIHEIDREYIAIVEKMYPQKVGSVGITNETR